jgi:O-antigen/teichoic acid export membrane protein
MEAARNRVVQLAGRGWDQVKSPLYRNALFIMLTSVIGSGLGFFFWVIVSNRYSREDMGAAVTLFSTLGFLAALGNLGIGIGLIRFMPEMDDKSALVNTGLTVSGLVTLVLSLVFLLVLPAIIPTMSFVLQEPLYIVTIVAATVALGLAPILDSAAIAVRRADYQTWRTTIFAFLKIPLALGVVAFLPGRAGIFLSLAAAFGISVVVLGVFFLRRAVPGYRPRPDFRFNRIRPLLGFSLGNYVAGAIGAAGVLLPTALIYDALGTAGPTNAAYFYVAIVVASLLYIIPGAAFTSFYAEASHKDMDRSRGERQAILLSLGLLIPAIVVMWFFADPMLRLFGNPAYADEAVTPLRILTFASIPVFLNGILGTRVRVRKRTIPLIISATIATAITLGLGWILLHNPDLGIDGLAYAYVLGQVAATPYLYFEARGAYEAIPTESLLGQPLE